MSLIHPSVAYNAAAMGYYPTDDATMRGISHLLAPSTETVKFLDPCCGCATAITALADRRRYPGSERYGIELDVERSALAKGKLTALLTGSALDSHVTPQSVDVLFLNPPYGDALRDREAGDKSQRLEHQFLSRFFPALRAGGLLIYIIPKSQLTEKIQKWLLSHFTDLRLFEAATNRFNQCVVIGRKTGALVALDKTMLAEWQNCLSGKQLWSTLPQRVTDYYSIEGNPKQLRMTSLEMDAEGIAELISEHKGLWRDFSAQFTQNSDERYIHPLHDLTDWHTVLLISSGIVSGLVDNGRQTLLVRGRTVKRKTVKVRENDDGDVIGEEHRDRFETVIKAIDLTEASPAYGQIIIIK